MPSASGAGSQPELHFGPWEMNPYAWDLPINSTRPADQFYSRIEALERFLGVSYFISATVGGSLTFTLLYLVLFRTHGELRLYARMLFLSCMADLSFWFCGLAVETKTKLNDGVFIIQLTGWARLLDYDAQVVLWVTFVAHLTMMCYILPAQYYFRYHAVVHGRIMSLPRTLALYACSILAAVLMVVICWPAYRYSGDARPGFNYATLWYEQRPVPPLIIADINATSMKIYFVWGIVWVAGSYALATWIGYKTAARLREDAHLYSEKTKEMQRQLTQTLIVQSLQPFFISVGPLLAIMLPAFTHWDCGPHALFLMNLISYVPMANPLCTILFIAPYRRFVARCLCGGLGGAGARVQSASREPHAAPGTGQAQGQQHHGTEKTPDKASSSSIHDVMFA